MKNKTQTFNEILLKVAKPNMNTLMKKARNANRLAKIVTYGRAKRRVYKVKVEALSSLKEKFPTKVEVKYDFRQGSGLVSVIIAQQNFALHAPADKFTLDA